MSATDEELRWADGQGASTSALTSSPITSLPILFLPTGVDHITWGLIDFSLSFIIFLWAKRVLAVVSAF